MPRLHRVYRNTSNAKVSSVDISSKAHATRALGMIDGMSRDIKYGEARYKRVAKGQWPTINLSIYAEAALPLCGRLSVMMIRCGADAGE